MFFTTKSSTAMSTSMMSSLERAVIVINGKNILVITIYNDNEVVSYSMWGMSKWGTSNGSRGGIPRSGNPDKDHILKIGRF